MKKPNTPTPSLSSFSDYTAARQRLGELQDTLAKTESEIRGGQLVAAARIANGKSAIEVEALALTTATAEDAKDAELEASLKELAHKREVLTAAIARQQEIINDIAGKRSRQVCEVIRPEYAAIVQAMVDALADVARVAQRERAFRDGLDAGGIAFTLPMVNISSNIIDVQDSSSAIAYILRDASEGYGIVPTTPIK